jgi:ubiquinone/menaquinone biosynthesis C-methylase UbiE
MNSSTAASRDGFGRLARCYRALEWIVYGRDLERARFAFIERLRLSRSILILGEGDGRFLAKLLETAPEARVDCVDASPGMLARAAARIGEGAARSRVRFIPSNIFELTFETNRYDAVVTLFFLDCFTPIEAEAAVARIREGLRPGALWLWADFVVPQGRWRALWARLNLTLLYLFFRWQTGISARALPPAEELLRRAGFQAAATRDLHGGLVRASLFARQPGPLL